MTRTASAVSVRVELAARLDAGTWARRHAAGEVPDRAPYGLDRMAAHGVVPTLHTTTLTGRTERLARGVRHRTHGLELVEAFRDPGGPADVVLAYDERTGVPAALRSRRTPVVSGVGWLTSPDATARAERAFVRRALPRLARVFTQCRPVTSLLTGDWGLDPARVAFVPLGIDTAFYRQQDFPPAGGGPRVFTAGEDRYRDHETLIAAVREIRRDRPDVRLDLATGLPTSFTPELGTLHTGRLDGAIRERYAASDVVAVTLHPTPTGSGLSVVLEAMASGRPVVVTANPGIEDYVEHGRTGLLVPAGDTRAVVTAVRRLLDDPTSARAMGRRAAVEARARFGSDTMAAGLAALCRDAVAAPRRTAPARRGGR